ncbi:hypothetical protein VITFI_CDS3095 [Vitreoscilla filiformis]|uniref:Uncharacterized protein n=1 Tax=Vitreoscilla filiformis TaxID=63 RepID=A0A221KIK1_VITFI|nr:hypothetical protein VITFI_CDS3095 [Vitreoscilla filiformis]
MHETPSVQENDNTRATPCQQQCHGWARKTVGNRETRLLLRKGQPASVPEQNAHGPAHKGERARPTTAHKNAAKQR